MESLKNEAGESLTEVKRKQNETQELLQVLQHLTELRDIRKQTAIYKGIFRKYFERLRWIFLYGDRIIQCLRNQYNKVRKLWWP